MRVWSNGGDKEPIYSDRLKERKFSFDYDGTRWIGLVGDNKEVTAISESGRVAYWSNPACFYGVKYDVHVGR